MTLFEIVDILKKIALDQPNIRTASDGSVYDKMNTNPSVQYDVFHISQTNHQEDFETDYYGLQLFYISRLEDSLEDNRLQIQSIGKEILGNVIRTFCENFSIDYPTITYIPFTQKFNDLTAGVYCNVRLEIPKDLVCPDNYLTEVIPGSDIRLQDLGITITQNGLRVITPDFPYDGIGEIRIVTDVPQASADLQYKEVEYTENGEYTVRPDPDYDGLTEVAVSVVVPDRYDEGYDDGKEDGIDEQKAKLESLSVSANGEYTRADGYSAITVDVPQYTGGTYQEGYEDGEAAQKAKLVSTAVTENGTYSKEDGYSAITVNVPQGEGYDEGYEDGVADQKAKLSTTSVTENGTYSREDGYSAITVNVPQGQGYEEGYEDGEAAQKAKLTVTSFTQNDTYTRADGWSAVTINVDDRYDEGYDEGVADQKAKLVSTAVTENGTYSKPDGYSAITVNVDDRYDEGYADGFAAGASACSGYFITAITLNVDSAITDTATATTTCSPSTAFTNIYYTSSDPSIATIDENTGTITVITEGTVIICAIDRFTRLQDCKTISVDLTPTVATAITLNVPSMVIGSGNTTVTVNPASAPTNITYSSSDNSIATIDNDGIITSVGEGTVTICAYDSISQLQSCQQVQVYNLSSLNLYYVTYSTRGLSRTLTLYDPVSERNNILQIEDISDNNKVITPGNYGRYTFSGNTEHTLKYYIKATGNTAGLFANNDSQHPTGIIAVNIDNGLGPSITTIQNNIFAANTRLSSITIPNTVTIIGHNSFYQCPIESLTLPPNLQSIGSTSFMGGVFTAVTIPATVTSIGAGCFYQCQTLVSVTLDGTTPPTIPADGIFGDTPALEHIYVPSASVNTYKNAVGWNEYANIISAKP